jgi:hypothetical protein
MTLMVASPWNTPKRRARRHKVVGLVACCGPKKKQAGPAQGLYTSDLFKKSVAYVKHLGVDEWAILSAKCGLVWPTEIIAPYDKTLSKMKPEARRRWADKVREEIASSWPPGTTFVVLAGKHYLKALEGLEGYKIKEPLRGMQIGERLRFLKESVS